MPGRDLWGSSTGFRDLRATAINNTDPNIKPMFQDSFNGGLDIQLGARTAVGMHYVHIALMGDPTLRMTAVAPPTDLVVTTNRTGGTDLSWSASVDTVVGYIGRVLIGGSIGDDEIRPVAGAASGHELTINICTRGGVGGVAEVLPHDQILLVGTIEGYLGIPLVGTIIGDDEITPGQRAVRIHELAAKPADEVICSEVLLTG